MAFAVLLFGLLAWRAARRTHSDLRLEMNVQPSVTAGAGTSNIRVLLMELIPVPALTEPPRNYGV